MLVSTFFHNLLFLGVSLFSPAETDTPKDTANKEVLEKPLTTIAFGSCNKEDLPQPLWADIIINKPQLWIWLGGNIDSEAADAATLEEKCQRQLIEPGYSALRENTAIIGTWNYHTPKDALTSEDQKLFWDFMGAPEESPLRRQTGVYSSQTFGPKEKQVKVIMLDTHFKRDSLEKVGQTYKPNLTGDLLGEVQWQWLEQELKQDNSKVIILGNSTPIIPEEHASDKWANYPRSRERLYKLLARYANRKGVILLSGGRHLAEISKMKVKGLDKPLYEVTSSGLTHTVGRDYKSEANSHRISNVITKRNFGLIQIDWKKREALLNVHGDRNMTYLSQRMLF